MKWVCLWNGDVSAVRDELKGGLGLGFNNPVETRGMLDV